MISQAFRFFTSPLIVLIVVILPAQSLAAGDEFCNGYAYKALEQFASGNASNCKNLDEPLWSADFKHHYNWCRTVSQADANTAAEYRNNVLVACIVTSSPVGGTIVSVTKMVDPVPVAAMAASNQSYLTNINFAGGDIGVVWDAVAPSRCEAACNKNDQCKAWTWVQPGALPQINRPGLAGFCAIKGAGSSKITDACCVSAFKTKTVSGYNEVVSVNKAVAVDVAQLATLAGHSACDTYAQSSVAQQQRNLAMNCGFRGPPWNAKYDDHYNWCMYGKNQTVASGEQTRRQSALDKCAAEHGIPDPVTPVTVPGSLIQGQDTAHQGTITKVIPMTGAGATTTMFTKTANSCQRYAKNATIQQTQNIRLGCGLKGPQWNARLDDHYNWCMYGENLKYAGREQNSRQQALAPCKAETVANGRHPGLETGSRDDDPNMPQAVFVDPRDFAGGPMMVDAMQSATAKEPDCNDLRDDLIVMMSGGDYLPLNTGAYAWQPATLTTLAPNDWRLQQIISAGALNSQILSSANVHKTLRQTKLAEAFRLSPTTHQQIAALTGALATNMRPSSLARLDQLKLSNSPAGGGPQTQTQGIKGLIVDLSQATATRITSVCSLRDAEAPTASSQTQLWEGGFVFLIGRNFGNTTGKIVLGYEPCGEDKAQHCEDQRLSGKRVQPKSIYLNLISASAWSDRIIGVKLPEAMPRYFPFGVAQPKIWIEPAGNQPAVVSPPLVFNTSIPHVLDIETDSGFDPGGLLLNGWAHWSDPKELRHDIFWVWSQKIAQGAGLIRTNCPTCPKGQRSDAAHIASPGDYIYIYGEDFGDTPGQIYLSYDDPTVPGVGPKNLSHTIPIEFGATDWHDDRIRIRIKSTVAEPSIPQFPYLVIVNHKGVWISGKYNLAFSPVMAIKVVSGHQYLQLGHGEDDTASESQDKTSMVVSHPTGGCDSLWFIPLDTNESGRDLFLQNDKRIPREAQIKVISAEFAQLAPNVPIGKFLAKWGIGLAKEMARSGPLAGLFTYMVNQALEGGIRSIGGDNGAHYIYAQKNGYSDASDPSVDVEWENTCSGLFANETVKYSARFILSGPKRWLYPE